ncbi:hypothetical protein J8273_7793 [Carpediemonas membranifera]|uniref:Uncharacterized protein n=1 Tax=Carpediemonas membranifera TaxID=201153 RepID=A0A8J6DZA4_9EUKA|nr:hypothetical protein J8273_7793 [Carpediemonas membranifera]|eukprot:KAG9390443.1 hypothetical protein J8273_7793 [Carpediemonas membranifera]
MSNTSLSTRIMDVLSPAAIQKLSICQMPGDGVTQPTNVLTAATDGLLGFQLLLISVVFMRTFNSARRKTSKRRAKLSDFFMSLSMLLSAVMSFSGVKDHTTASIVAAYPYWVTVVLSGVLSSWAFCLACVSDCVRTSRRVTIHAVLPTLIVASGLFFTVNCNWTFVSFGISQLPLFMLGVLYSLAAYMHSRLANTVNILMIVGTIGSIGVQAGGAAIDLHLEAMPHFDYNVVFHFVQMAVFALFFAARMSGPVRREHSRPLMAKKAK